jgi:hypothetical protein
MRQLNTLRNSSKFKIRTSKLSAKSRPIERRLLLLPRRRVSVQRKPPLLLPIQMRVQKIKTEPRLKSKRLPLLMLQQRMRTANVSSPSIARARKSKIVTLMRKCVRFVVLS